MVVAGDSAAGLGLICHRIDLWMCLRRASSFPAPPSSSQPAQLVAPTPFLSPPSLRVCQLEKFLPLPFHPSENVGWPGTSAHSAGNCFCEGCCEAQARVPGPLPRPWPLCLGWNPVLRFGPSDSPTPSPEVLMHQVGPARVA